MERLRGVGSFYVAVPQLVNCALLWDARVLVTDGIGPKSIF
jgi:hypothetical protein